MERDAKIYIAGHQGLVGSALMRLMSSKGFTHIITKTAQELDLRRQQEVEAFFEQAKPEYVIIAAATVGGIYANISMPAPFLYDNLMIAAHIIHTAYKVGVKKLLFLGSSCIYPRDCPQPIQEHYLLTGPLEPTNEGYAIAKIAGIKLCQTYRHHYNVNFISCMPTNLYGPGDFFDEQKAHVVPALIAKMVKAQKEGLPEVTIWGSGTPRRDLLFIDDCAEALLFLMNHYNGHDALNIGSGTDYTISEIASMIQELVGFKGKLILDHTKPDGTPRKILSIDRLKEYGWQPTTSLRDGLTKTIAWYRTDQSIGNTVPRQQQNVILAE